MKNRRQPLSRTSCASSKQVVVQVAALSRTSRASLPINPLLTYKVVLYNFLCSWSPLTEQSPHSLDSVTKKSGIWVYFGLLAAGGYRKNHENLANLCGRGLQLATQLASDLADLCGRGLRKELGAKVIKISHSHCGYRGIGMPPKWV